MILATSALVRRTDSHGNSVTIPFDQAVQEIIEWLTAIGCWREAEFEHVAAELRGHPVKSDFGFFYEAKR